MLFIVVKTYVNIVLNYKSCLLTTKKQITNSKPLESCVETCERNKLVCEHNYFPAINKVDSFVKSKSFCTKHDTINPVVMRYEDPTAVPTYFPGHNLLTNVCLIQTDEFLFSCVSKPPENFIRLCPCRKKFEV